MQIIVEILISIVGFITGFWKKFLSKSVIIGFQLFFTSSTITIILSFYFFIATTLVFVYNKIHSFFDSINSYSSDSKLSCFFHLLHCSGLDVVFVTFFNELYVIFITMLLFKLFSFTRWAMKVISDEMFKLGVLLGL
ncbi:hypothetical protein [Caminibacter sp.]